MLGVCAPVPSPALARQDDDRRSAQQLWDAYPLRAAQDKPAPTAHAPAIEAASAGSEDVEWAALAITLALMGGGVTGWLVSLRRPQRRMRLSAALAAAPAIAPARSTAPRLWPPPAAPTSTPAPPRPGPPAARRPPGAPAPPAPERAWAAEIGWHLVDGASQFRVTARSVDGGDEPITLSASALLDWPPAGARSVQALTDAVRALESTLVAAGWTPLPRGSAWYAKRFTWQPGARPPAAPATPGRVRHRRLYEAEYARHVDRTRRLRQTMAARVASQGRSDDAVGAVPE